MINNEIPIWSKNGIGSCRYYAANTIVSFKLVLSKSEFYGKVNDGDYILLCKNIEKNEKIIKV